MLPSNLTSYEDVPDAVVKEAFSRWQAIVREQQSREWPELVDCRPWLFAEAMQYLMNAILLTLGVDKPLAVSFSFMDSLVYGGECEVLLVWQSQPNNGIMGPYEMTSNCCAMRMVDVQWPPMVEFLTDEDSRNSYIKRWFWHVSAAAEDMPKEEK